MRPLSALAALALIAAPAQAATYGPPAPVAEAPRSVAERQSFELLPDETMEEAEARLTRDTGTAWKRFWISQGLAATDIALTCYALSQRNPDGSAKFREANPIYGRNASCGKIAAIRGGISALQYMLAKRSIEHDPTKAKKGMLISIGFAGLPVAWNIYQLGK